MFDRCNYASLEGRGQFAQHLSLSLSLSHPVKVSKQCCHVVPKFSNMSVNFYLYRSRRRKKNYNLFLCNLKCSFVAVSVGNPVLLCQGIFGIFKRDYQTYLPERIFN